MDSADTNNHPLQHFAPQAPQSLQVMGARFCRYGSEEESRYLLKIAKRDAWSSLYQWIFPAIFLTLLVLAFWLYRKELEFLVQRTDNPREFSLFISLVLRFFVLLLHIALAAYLFKILRMLQHFKHRDSAHSAQKSGSQPVSEESGNSSSNYAIYRIEGQPGSTLSLVLTSRSGVRRYRWHYYLGDLPLTPLPQSRPGLPLYVQKKSWKDLGQASEAELSSLFPDHKWLQLCLQSTKTAKKKKDKLQADVVLVEYYDFHFYYLCAIQVKQFSAAADLLEEGTLPSTEQQYSLLPAT